MEHCYAVILAGGKGERFWPLSTSKKPKQLLSLVGDKPLLAQAVDRLEGLVPPERVLVVTNADLVDASLEAAPMLPRKNIIGEPMGRDTAAAVALAASVVKARDPQGVFSILTADHIIKDLDVFRQTLRESYELAEEQNVLVTIGIEPTEPSTGYGYIETGGDVAHHGTISFTEAVRFVEKPDLSTAQSYLDAGTFLWNSGMFIWSVASIEDAFRQFRPQLADLIDQLVPCVDQPGFDEALLSAFNQLEKISIDYAVMEKADNIVTARGTFSWDDVGSWPALENHFDKDSSQNIMVGDGQAVEASGNIVVSNGHLTALIGVDNLVVVQAPGVTLVCPKEKAQLVKAMVQKLGSDGSYDKVL